jgi:hypothetical protein
MRITVRGHLTKKPDENDNTVHYEPRVYIVAETVQLGTRPTEIETKEKKRVPGCTEVT